MEHLGDVDQEVKIDTIAESSGASGVTYLENISEIKNELANSKNKVKHSHK